MRSVSDAQERAACGTVRATKLTRRPTLGGASWHQELCRVREVPRGCVRAAHHCPCSNTDEDAGG